MTEDYRVIVPVHCPGCQVEIEIKATPGLAQHTCSSCGGEFWPDAALLKNYYDCDRFACYSLETLLEVSLTQFAMTRDLEQSRAEAVVTKVFSEVRRTKYDPDDDKSAPSEEKRLVRYGEKKNRETGERETRDSDHRSSVRHWIEKRTLSRVLDEQKKKAHTVSIAAETQGEQTGGTPREYVLADSDLSRRAERRASNYGDSQANTDGLRIKAGQTFVVASNAVAGTVTGVPALTKRVKTSLTWQVVGGNEQDLFAIEPNTGEIRLRDAGRLQPATTYRLKLTVSDGTRSSEPQDVIVRTSGHMEATRSSMEKRLDEQLQESTNSASQVAEAREQLTRYLEVKDAGVRNVLDEREQLVFRIWYSESGAQGWNKLAATALEQYFPDQGKTPAAAARLKDQAIEKLNEYFEQQGLEVQLPKKTTTSKKTATSKKSP